MSNIDFFAKNAAAFVGLCYKIAKGGKGRMSYDIYFDPLESAPGLFDVYGVHTIHDDDLMEFAYECAQKGDRSMVEYYYNRLVQEYGLTPDELRSFQDTSDFIEFLRGGIAGYNSCKRSGSDFEISQKIGTFSSSSIDMLFNSIMRECARMYPAARIKRVGQSLSVHV